MRRDIEAAPELYVALNLALAPSQSIGERVSGSKTSPLPLRLTILSAGTTLAAVLADWEHAVAHVERLSRPRRRVRESYGVNRAARLLAGRVEIACQISPEHALQLGRTTAVSRRLLGLTRLVHRLDAPCPGCGLFSLNREDGAAVVRCISCGACWSEELYQHLVQVIVAEYENQETLTGDGRSL